MAKRTCDPTVGSIGSQTYLLGRNGQVVRARVIPANPNTAQQITARANMRLASKGYDALTQAQISAWIALAATFQTAPRLGMSGVMTGNQLYVKINAALLEVGAAQVSDPPAEVTFTPLAATLTDVINNGGALTLTATFVGALPAGTSVWAAAPQNPGVRRIPAKVRLGACPALVGQVADLAALYEARFGVPAVGDIVYVSLQQQTTGWKGPELPLSSIVGDGS